MSTSAARYNIHEAKTHFSKIVERVEHGEEVTISRAGQPFAKVVPLPPRANRRGYGSLRGRITMAADWDAPATNEKIAQEFGLIG
ncbi:MAG TPA: type II toxin-antitoxin system Phd/YefM family antitoxin [Candidatus Stackebrandtia faecavium]|nr:type II toxin-antitoxin system Phd/YefM family antitoxin [Candidatus Stackebrandtia faecavium]